MKEARISSKRFQVLSFNQSSFQTLFDSSNDRTQYLFGYLEDIGAETLFVENEYVDKSYLIDYSNYFSRSFKDPGRFSKRVHVFDFEFDETDFRGKFLSPGSQDGEFLSRMDDNYLGFFVIKPIESTPVGRTLLTQYPEIDSKGNRRRFPTISPHTAHLFGKELTVSATPYQEQDQSVAACATTAIWSTLNKLSELFGIKSEWAPSELRSMASEVMPSRGRIYPSSGLNIYQMIGLYRELGLDADYLNCLPSEHRNIIPEYIFAYLSFGMPIVAHIKLKRRRSNGKYASIGDHAVTITGFKLRSDHSSTRVANRISHLYVHDDQIGPYSWVEPADSFFDQWKNEWNTKESRGGFDKADRVKLIDLIVPTYEKIRISFDDLRHWISGLSRFEEPKKEANSYKMYLTSINDYKDRLRSCRGPKLEDFLVKNMPRFLWVVQYNYGSGDFKDYLFDATDHRQPPDALLDGIEYNCSSNGEHNL